MRLLVTVRLLVTATTWLVAVCLLVPATSVAGRANAGLPGVSASNPLDSVNWGRFHTPSIDPSNDAPSAYLNTARTARHRATFAKIVAQPRFRWFGAWNPVFTQGRKPGARAVVRRYKEIVTGGDPDVGLQVAVFRLFPFEHAACRTLPTVGQRRDYRRWVREFSAGIGRTRTALVLQPDMPFVLCAPGRS